MRAALVLAFLAGSLLATGCSLPSAAPSAAPAAPLPDARDLSENPLDVIGLPQP